MSEEVRHGHIGAHPCISDSGADVEGVRCLEGIEVVAMVSVGVWRTKLQRMSLTMQ